jgi:F0F1-type ATP synthase membrane subunit a
MLNPFEQFSPYQVHLFVDFKLNGCSNTNFSMSLAFIIMLIFVVFTYTSGFTASGLNGLVLRAVENVKAIVQTNLHTARNQYFPPLMYLFFTILLANAMGMTPFSITLTSSLVFTTFLALTYYLGANITGVARNE